MSNITYIYIYIYIYIYDLLYLYITLTNIHTHTFSPPYIYFKMNRSTKIYIYCSYVSSFLCRQGIFNDFGQGRFWFNIVATISMEQLVLFSSVLGFHMFWFSVDSFFLPFPNVFDI